MSKHRKRKRNERRTVDDERWNRPQPAWTHSARWVLWLAFACVLLVIVGLTGLSETIRLSLRPETSATSDTSTPSETNQAVAPAVGEKSPWPPQPVVPPELAEFEPRMRRFVQSFIDQVSDDPGSAERHAVLGVVYAANGMLAEARASFRNVADLDTTRPLGKYHQACTTHELGDVSGAVGLLEEVVADFPDFAPAVHRLGDALMDLGKVEQAAVHFTAAIRLAPAMPQGYTGLASVLVRTKQFDEAHKLLAGALRLNPDNRRARYLLGMTYRGLGRNEDAKRELALGAGAEKTYIPDAWSVRIPSYARGLTEQLTWAMDLIGVGRVADGVGILETALEWHPENVKVLNNLAIGYLELGKTEKAEALLLRAKKLDGEQGETFINLAAIYISRGQFNQALENAERAIELAPKTARAHRTQARTLERLGRDAEAVSAFEKAAAFDSSNPSIFMELGDVCVRLGRLEEARLHFQELVKWVPTAPEAQLRLCQVCIRLGLLDEAAKALAVARAIVPNDATVWAMAERIGELSDR